MLKQRCFATEGSVRVSVHLLQEYQSCNFILSPVPACSTGMAPQRRESLRHGTQYTWLLGPCRSLRPIHEVEKLRNTMKLRNPSSSSEESPSLGAIPHSYIVKTLMENLSLHTNHPFRCSPDKEDILGDRRASSQTMPMALGAVDTSTSCSTQHRSCLPQARCYLLPCKPCFRLSPEGRENLAQSKLTPLGAHQPCCAFGW